MATWRSKLTKQELNHLKVGGIHTLKELRETRKFQIEVTKFDCFECKHIAIKLGIE
jgi:hypothetical protein